MGGADNLLNLLPVSVKPWIKALVNRSDVVIVREADSQDTLQLNCWCLPSREEKTHGMCKPQESAPNKQTLRFILEGTHRHAKSRYLRERQSNFNFSLSVQLGEAGRPVKVKNVETMHLSWSIKDTKIFKQLHTASKIRFLAPLSSG